GSNDAARSELVNRLIEHHQLLLIESAADSGARCGFRHVAVSLYNRRAMPAEVLAVQSRRAGRMRKAQIAQHVIAAFVLVNAGIEHGAHSPLAIAEIIAGGMLIVSVLRERLQRGEHQHGIAWVELAGAAMVAVEAIEKTKGTHHVSFVILSFI